MTCKQDNSTEVGIYVGDYQKKTKTHDVLTFCNSVHIQERLEKTFV